MVYSSEIDIKAHPSSWGRSKRMQKQIHSDGIRNIVESNPVYKCINTVFHETKCIWS